MPLVLGAKFIHLVLSISVKNRQKEKKPIPVVSTKPSDKTVLLPSGQMFNHYVKIPRTHLLYKCKWAT